MANEIKLNCLTVKDDELDVSEVDGKIYFKMEAFDEYLKLDCVTSVLATTDGAIEFAERVIRLAKEIKGEKQQTETKSAGQLKEELYHMSNNYDKVCSQNIALHYEVELWKHAFEDLKDRVDGLQFDIERADRPKTKTLESCVEEFKEVDTEAIVKARTSIYKHAVKIMRERAARKYSEV